MASPNFKYAKRQKELEKQKKNEEKRLRKLAKRNGTAEEVTPELDENGEIINAEVVPTDVVEETSVDLVNPNNA